MSLMNVGGLMCCKSTGNLTQKVFKIIHPEQDLVKFKLRINVVQK